MTRKRKWLLANTILLTVYFFVSIPYYISESSSLEGVAVAAALYFAFVFIHGVAIFFAVSTQWLGYLSHHRAWIKISTVLQFLGGLAFIISFIVIIPFMLINLFTLEKKIKPVETTTVEIEE